MSEQINSGQAEEQEVSTSGLLLSVEPLAASATINASDGNADTGGSGEKDTSDDSGADTDSSDSEGADTDLTDALGADGGSDTSDSDSSDGGSDAGSEGKDHSDDASTITIDSKDA
jgi:hypothetical protein